MPLDDLRGLDDPVLAILRDERVVVLEEHGLLGWHVMDPLRGTVLLRHQALRELYSGRGFELREESTATALLPLSQRAFGFARARAGDSWLGSCS